MLDFLECDRPLGDCEQAGREPIFEEDFDRSGVPDKPACLSKATRHMFRQSAKHSWYSLASLKEVFCCVDLQVPEEEAASLVEEKEADRKSVV